MPMTTGTPRPSFEGATAWFNATGAAAAAQAEGHPTLVHFWSISCDLCKKTLPRVQKFRDERAGEGLRVVAIHLPRGEADTDAEAVREAVAMHKITEPCAMDNEHKLRAAFQHKQGEVPAYYLFDRAGKLRSYAAGAQSLDMLESAIERVLTTEDSKASAGAVETSQNSP
ncbi:MAG: TlpA family protein disulfide reductase [Pyrinomonadaceae bacterium]|nr:TlpA family protein disulfide reductase [Pyrinomonadaceae bacterium]